MHFWPIYILDQWVSRENFQIPTFIASRSYPSWARCNTFSSRICKNFLLRNWNYFSLVPSLHRGIPSLVRSKMDDPQNLFLLSDLYRPSPLFFDSCTDSSFHSWNRSYSCRKFRYVQGSRTRPISSIFILTFYIVQVLISPSLFVDRYVHKWRK